ncbi:hypothetical protein V1504DRAFT_398549 [Lipomyces starkeyi]
MKHGRNSFWNIYSLFANLSHMQDRHPWGALQQPPATSQTNVVRVSSDSSLVFTKSTTDIVSMNKSFGKVENPSSDYGKALHLLQNNPPEHRLDIHLSYSQYLKLEKNWSKFKSEKNISDDQSLEQIATVVTIQRDIHEVAAAELREIISSSVKEYLSMIHKPQALYDIVDSGSATAKGFDRDYAKSSKEPDGSFKYWGPRGRNMRIAIEVGLSENYTALCRDKDMWIRGQHVKVVILIYLKESPQFKNPTTSYKNIEDADLELARMQQNMYEATRSNREKGTYGPIEYRTHLWFGKLNEAFIEVWRAEREDDGPLKYSLIEDGRSTDVLPKTIGLKISNFFTEDAWAAANIPDSNVTFDEYIYLQKLLAAVGLTAQLRFVDFFL